MGIIDIYKIWRQIVIDSPYLAGGQLNSFAVIDSLSQLNSVTTELTHEDYRKGFFWSRSTANKGATKGLVKMEYDLLYVETVKTSNVSSPFGGETCHPMFISVASPVECETCNYRNIPEIDEQNLFNLQTALREFFTYGLYKVIYNGMEYLDGSPMTGFDGEQWLFLAGETSELWLSEGRAAWLNAKDEFMVSGPKKVITSIVNPGPIEIFQGGKYLDNLRIKTVQIEVCNCVIPVKAFNYQDMTTTELLMLKCDSC